MYNVLVLIFTKYLDSEATEKTQKKLQFHLSCPLGKQLPQFACAGPLPACLAWNLSGTLPIGFQDSFKSYFPSKKMYLSGLPDGIFFQALYY